MSNPTPLDPTVHNPPSPFPSQDGGAIGGRVQLYATIKRSSEYRHQHDGKVPFDVEFVNDAYGAHCVLGNNNRYRIADLRFYVKLGERFVTLS
jgi:hypothetical protein